MDDDGEEEEEEEVEEMLRCLCGSLFNADSSFLQRHLCISLLYCIPSPTIFYNIVQTIASVCMLKGLMQNVFYSQEEY